jgi:hypothetical protein
MREKLPQYKSKEDIAFIEKISKEAKKWKKTMTQFYKQKIVFKL